MMHYLTSAVLAVCVLSPVACAQRTTIPITEAEIVATYPHDPDAFTQGLFFADGVLHESTGQVGQSTLRRVDLETGVVEQSADIQPPYFGEGSVRVGDEIFMLTWQAGIGFIFDAETFEQIDTFSYPGEGWGLTFDGTRLILSDGTPVLRFLDPETMELTGTIDVTLNGRPRDDLNELEWINGEIWANIWRSRFIVRIDPATGRVLAVVDLDPIIRLAHQSGTASVANGIAWNAETDQIFITGKLWSELYEISVGVDNN
jgi:glutamine cyclotransferase